LKPGGASADVPGVPTAEPFSELELETDPVPVRSTRLWMGRQRWEQVVAEASPADRPPPAAKPTRRREPRHHYRVSCLIRLGGSGEMGVYAVDTRNISRQGMGFRHDRLVEPDTPCLVALRDPHARVTLHPAIVRWCSPIEPIGFDTGIAFQQPIDLDGLIRTR
jgi:hypothetical protein